MGRRVWAGGFGAGLLAGAVGAVVVLGGRGGARAQAQPEIAAGPGRYQLMTWSYPGLMNSPTGVAASPWYGAYVLDTANGYLWRTVDRGGLEMVGRGQ